MDITGLLRLHCSYNLIFKQLLAQLALHRTTDCSASDHIPLSLVTALNCAHLQPFSYRLENDRSTASCLNWCGQFCCSQLLLQRISSGALQTRLCLYPPQIRGLNNVSTGESMRATCWRFLATVPICFITYIYIYI